MPHPSFANREQELHAAASKATGLDDFGDPDYQIGLRALLAAIDSDMVLTEAGRHVAYGTVFGALTARLQVQEGWRRHPEVRGNTVRRPLVITGIPRTGTTALHKLLSMDEQFQGLEHWLAATPMVRPPRNSWGSNPAYQASVAALEAFFSAMPEMRKAHDIVADEVDECLEILQQSFVSNRFGAGMHVPSYDQWFFAQDEHDSYRRYADVLRLIGAAEPDKPWLLKNPGHIAQLDCLLSVFPDACIVQTHRNPVQAMPSLCSTLHMARRMFEGDAAHADVLAARECAYWSRAVADADVLRATRPQQFYDVDHRRFHEAPLATVQGIYERFGLSLSAAAEQRMRRWIEDNPTSRHGAHRYRTDDYGMNEAQIRDSFAHYIDRYDF